jgi:hypothetical protein
VKVEWKGKYEKQKGGNMSRPLIKRVDELLSAVFALSHRLEVVFDQVQELRTYAGKDEKRDARARKKAGFRKKKKGEK